jgi:hypothetical protein
MYRREKSCHVEGWDSCGPATIPTILNRDFFKGLPWCVRICSLFVSLTCCGVRERVFFNVLLLIPDQKKTTLVFSMFLTQYSIFDLALCAPHSPLTLLSCCKIGSIFSKVEWLYRMANLWGNFGHFDVFWSIFHISKVRAHVNMQLLTSNDALR